MSWESNNSLLPFEGQSMNWLLLPGDEILLEQEYAEIKPGDILLFRNEGELTCHRALWIGHEKIVTKGDRSCLCEQIRRDHIIGKVEGVRKGRILFKFKNFPLLVNLMTYLSKEGLEVVNWRRKFSLLTLFTIQLLFLCLSEKKVLKPSSEVIERLG